MIVRDEAGHLPACLASIRDQVDEIVVADTGSVDDSPRIAADFGCHLLHFPWIDNFSAARNHALDHARGKWILYIDADERLSVEAGRNLAEIVTEREKAAALRLRFFPRPTMTAYAEPRLFRNDERIRFVGAMHESALPGIHRVCKEDGLGVADCFDISLTHYGFEGDRTRKHARNLPLLRRAIVEQPERVYIRLHLGGTLLATGAAEEGKEQLRHGMELAGRPAMPVQSRVEGAACAVALASLEMEEGRPDAALAVIHAGLELYPPHQTLHWMRARAFLALRRETEAVPILERLAGQEGNGLVDPAVAYDRTLFGEHALGLLGSVWFRLGEYEKAAGCYERAAAKAADPLEFQAKLALARARAGSSTNLDGHRRPQ